MNKYNVLIRAKNIRYTLVVAMNMAVGEIKRDIQEDIAALDKLITYYTETYKD